MKYGLDITPAGPWGRPDRIAELAALAEQCGWDGVFCEDYLCFPAADDAADGEPPPDTYDVWITLALIAQATSRVTLGTMVTPLPAPQARSDRVAGPHRRPPLRWTARPGGRPR